MMKRLILLVLLLSVQLFGQKFTASVEKTTVGENERFKVFFTFEGGNYNNLKNFEAPDFEGFRVLGGPNQSTSMQIVNGQVNSSIVYSYILQAQKLGTFTIDKAKIAYNTLTYTTVPFKIKVVKGGSGKSGAGGISDEELSKNVFIRAIPDKTTLYKGEQLKISYKLYFKGRIGQPSLSTSPDYPGFWSENLDGNINTVQEMYEGVRYNTAVLREVALFPTKLGKITIDPLELDVPVLISTKKRSGGDVFDQFFNDSFFGRTEKIPFTAKSNKLVVTVKDLPDGAPASFNGAVGNFDFTGSIDKNNLTSDDAVTINLRLSGTGNVNLITLPKPELPAGFEQYDPKTSENVNRTNRISGVKTVEYLIVPRVPGTKIIPQIEFSFFNPLTKKYSTQAVGPFELNVTQGKNPIQANTSGYVKEDVKLLNQDIRFIKTSEFELEKISDNAGIPTWFWIGLAVPPFVLLVLVLVMRRNDKISGDVDLVRFRKAEKEAKNRLKVAKAAIAGGDAGKFYNEISLALNHYLENKLNIQRSEFTVDKAITQLTEFGIDEVLIGKVKKVSETCEFARFAPGAGTKEAEENLYNETLDVIVKLENSGIKRK